MNFVLPRSIKVGAWDYAVEWWDTNDAHASGRYGETQHNTQTIRISENYGPRQSAATLLHEILHAVYYRWTIQRKDSEEAIVLRFAEGLIAVIRDNPMEWEWIASGIQRDEAPKRQDP